MPKQSKSHISFNNSQMLLELDIAVHDSRFKDIYCNTLKFRERLIFVKIREGGTQVK